MIGSCLHLFIVFLSVLRPHSGSSLICPPITCVTESLNPVHHCFQASLYKLFLIRIIEFKYTTMASLTPPFDMLVFSKTAGYRHESIPAGVKALKKFAASTGHITCHATEDASAINPENLARYHVLVFLHTSGTFLDEKQLAALKYYIHLGGGFVGIHGASAGMPGDEWYEKLIGAGQYRGIDLVSGTCSIFVISRSQPVSPLSLYTVLVKLLLTSHADQHSRIIRSHRTALSRSKARKTVLPRGFLQNGSGMTSGTTFGATHATMSRSS